LLTCSGNSQLLKQPHSKQQHRSRRRSVRQDGRTTGRQDGRTAGRQDGRTAGWQDGGTAGRRDGRTAGQQDGRTAGRQDGGKTGRRDGRTAQSFVVKRFKISFKNSTPTSENTRVVSITKTNLLFTKIFTVCCDNFLQQTNKYERQVQQHDTAQQLRAATTCFTQH